MTVRIKTKPFGEIDVDEKQIVHFPEGIFGFDYIKKFVILDSSEGSPFKWLQAYSEPELAFVIIQPIHFMGEYELSVSLGELEIIGAEKPDDLLVFAIVTIPSESSNMTANLQGPIIINPKNRNGKQAIALNDKYRVKHKILEEMQNRTGKEE